MYSTIFKLQMYNNSINHINVLKDIANLLNFMNT